MYEALHCTNNILESKMILIDGKKAAAELREQLKQEVSGLKSKYNKVPGLTVILIGDLTPSQIYVRNKEKSANEVGLKSEVIKYPDSVEEKTVLEKIEELKQEVIELKFLKLFHLYLIPQFFLKQFFLQHYLDI